MVRVAGLLDQIDAGIEKPREDGRTPAETIAEIRRVVHAQLERQTACLNDELRPALHEHGICIVPCSEVAPEHRAELDERFRRQIFPVLTPLAVGLGRPFPYISNLSLSLAVLVRDPQTGQETFARVKVPKEMLPRFVPVGDGRTFVPLEDLIAQHLDKLFPGMEIVDHDVFRVTRDADFTVSDEADDLLRAVEDELRRRRFGEVVRVEVAAGMAPELREPLTRALGVDEADVFPVSGLLDLKDLWDVYKVSGFADLRDRPWTPVTQPRLLPDDDEPPDVMAAMRRGDLLAPPPLRLVLHLGGAPGRAGGGRPGRAGHQDDRVPHERRLAARPALIRASERGKQAVCLVELKARFDERANIQWARALEESGVHVVYGLPALKTHAKCILIVRREGGGVRHYVHVGHGQLQPEDRAPVHGLRAADLRRPDGRRRRGHVQPAHGLRAPAALPPRARRPGLHARRDHRRDRAARSPPRPEGRHGADRDEDELARGQGVHPRRCTAPRRPGCRSTSTSAGSAACARACPGVSENDPRRLDRRALPRALAHLRLRARRRADDLHRLGRSHAAQPRHARGAAQPRAGPRGCGRS